MSLEGITDVVNAGSNVDAGQFNLPTEFDVAQYASRWVKKGNAVEQARQPEPLMGTNKQAAGWELWKYPKTNKEKKAGLNCEANLKSGTYMLMFRKRSIQDNVNAIYGNVSKELLMREQRGETVGGAVNTDSGLISDERISKKYGLTEFGDDNGSIALNKITSSAAKVEADPEVVATTED